MEEKKKKIQEKDRVFCNSVRLANEVLLNYPSYSAFCRDMGISTVTFTNKIYNRIAWSEKEKQKMYELLHLNDIAMKVLFNVPKETWGVCDRGKIDYMKYKKKKVEKCEE